MSVAPTTTPVRSAARLKMSAVVQEIYGSATVLQTRVIARPSITANQVLIRVRAAGVNIADWAVMSGLPYIARPVYGLRKPKNAVRGTDVAGVVEDVGSGITRFQIGDEVFGSAVGSFAEYAAAAEDQLAPKPANLTFEQAATVPMAGLVAMQALRGVKPGQKVLVNGASGGVGTFAVQIARALLAEVTGVCSTRNVDMVRSIGADHVIDYTRDDFTANGESYDLILDNVSTRSLSDLRRSLISTGTLVPNGGRFDQRWFSSAGRITGGKLIFRIGSKSMRTFLVSMKSEELLVLKELIEAGKVTPVIDRVYPLREAAQAMSHVGGGHARGKVAITI